MTSSLRTGRFITLEGTEGSGKSTQIRRLNEYLLDHQPRPVHVIREPGGVIISERSRELLRDAEHTVMHPHCETLLYLAARAQ
jgi:dTMP kinase